MSSTWPHLKKVPGPHLPGQELNGGAMKAVADWWPEYMTERIGLADDMPSVQVKPENDPDVQRLLALQR